MDPHKLFPGIFWGQTKGPKRAILGHTNFSSLLFPIPTLGREFKSTPCMTGRRFHRTMEMIPALP